nr:MAG TPA: hypothetical protein [Caudoviricetes sp.]
MRSLEFAIIRLADISIVHSVLLSSILLKKLKNRASARAKNAEDKVPRSWQEKAFSARSFVCYRLCR